MVLPLFIETWNFYIFKAMFHIICDLIKFHLKNILYELAETFVFLLSKCKIVENPLSKS